MDSRLRGNDKRNAGCSQPGAVRTVPKRVQGQAPAKGLGVVPPDEVQETSCRESEGVPQIFFLMSPKIEDPPQDEWGIKGVENEFNNSDG